MIVSFCHGLVVLVGVGFGENTVVGVSSLLGLKVTVRLGALVGVSGLVGLEVTVRFGALVGVSGLVGLEVIVEFGALVGTGNGVIRIDVAVALCKGGKVGVDEEGAPLLADTTRTTPIVTPIRGRP